jgi:hypothetical protein
LSDPPLGSSGALTEQELFLAHRILWGVLLTPLAGSFGAALLFAVGSVTNLRWDVRPDSSWQWTLAVLLFFAPIVGGFFAAPVTMLVLPIARGRLPRRGKGTLSLFALIGLVSGFLSPPLLMLTFAEDKAQVFKLNSLLLAGLGAGSGLITAILFFFLTDGARRVWLRSACVGLLLSPVAVFVGAWLLRQPEMPKEPPALGDLKLHDLIKQKPIPRSLRGIAIDPNASTPFALFHRPHDSWTPPFEAKILVPPRLLHDFYVRSIDEDGAIAVSAMRLEALLPDLALRTPKNLDALPDGAVLNGYDVLDVTLAYVQQLGPFPDDWFRGYANCKRPNLEAEPDFDGLSVNPNHRPADWGIGMWVACQRADALPDGHEPVIHCWKDPFTKEFTTCTVELVLPWQIFGPETAEMRAPRRVEHNGKKITRTSGWGIAVIYHFPAQRLPQWRRIRELSLCLIEATVVSIPELTYPGRDAALCARIKQALADRRDVLAPINGAP